MPAHSFDDVTRHEIKLQEYAEEEAGVPAPQAQGWRRHPHIPANKKSTSL
jgi:hypothetical protein